MRAVSLLFHDVYVTEPSESGFRSGAADRYKLPLADFTAQLAGVAAARPDMPATVADGGVRGDGPTPYLVTVDDGGLSYFTIVAEALEARGWRGHCFVTTDFIGAPGFLNAAQIRELDRRGHVIGSHSASHPARFSACTFERMVHEWSDSRRALEDLLGHAVDLASVPGGYFSPAVARAAQAAGIRVLFTSEPRTAIEPTAGCLLVGRFTIRHGDPAEAAQRYVLPAPWARTRAWLAWNAKGLLKPLLGPSYMRISDWLHSVRPKATGPATERVARPS